MKDGVNGPLEDVHVILLLLQRVRAPSSARSQCEGERTFPKFDLEGVFTHHSSCSRFQCAGLRGRGDPADL